MLFEIKSRYTGSVLFSLECGSMKVCVEAAVRSSANLRFADLRSANLRFADLRFADLSSANLSSADLRSADLRSANLRFANLRFADLSSANLSFADLSSANLSSADLRFANLSFADLSSANLSFANLRFAKWPKDATVLTPPLLVRGLLWTVTIFGSHMQIGCEVHSIREWEAFDDRRILEMSGKEALEFWRLNKTRLLAFRDVEAEEVFASKSLQPEPVTAEEEGGA